MKKILVHAAFALTFLLTLGAVFGVANSASVHAATVPAIHVVIVRPGITKGMQPVLAKGATSAAASKLVTPLVERDYNCSNSGDFLIATDFNSNLDCFDANNGTSPLGVTLYNVSWFCTGAYGGNVIGYNDSDGYLIQYEFGPQYNNGNSYCTWFRGDGNYINVVSSIGISSLARA